MIPDSVFVVDHSRADHARVGDGATYKAHKGRSRKVADAVLADAADTDADIFVTEDVRARKWYDKLRGENRALDYSAFRGSVLGLVERKLGDTDQLFTCDADSKDERC